MADAASPSLKGTERLRVRGFLEQGYGSGVESSSGFVRDDEQHEPDGPVRCTTEAGLGFFSSLPGTANWAIFPVT